GTVRLWDAETGREQTPPLRHDKEVKHVAFSPDGDRVATACADGAARIWNAVTGELAAPPLKHAFPVYQVVFSPDGRLVVTVSRDSQSGSHRGGAHVWDAETGRQLHNLRDDKQTNPVIYHASFSPDGRRLVTGGSHSVGGQKAVVWDVATGVVT